MNLGEKLKRIRNEKGFPQKQIADYLGLHRTNYSKIENNLQKLTPEQIKLFCEFCDVSSDYLLGIESVNKKTISIQDRDDIRRKLKEIDDLVKE